MMSSGGQRFTVLSVLTSWPVKTIPILILGSPSCGCSSSPSIPGCHFCVYGYPQYTLYLLLLFGCGLEKQRKLSLAAAAKSLQSCLTLCDPIDDSPTGFPVPGILQAKTLEWVSLARLVYRRKVFTLGNRP